MKTEQFDSENRPAPEAYEVLPEIKQKQLNKDIEFIENLENGGRIKVEMCSYNFSSIHDAEKVMKMTTPEEVIGAVKKDPSMAFGDLDGIRDHFNGQSGELRREKTIVVKELGNVRIVARLQLTQKLKKDSNTGVVVMEEPLLLVKT